MQTCCLLCYYFGNYWNGGSETLKYIAVRNNKKVYKKTGKLLIHFFENAYSF